MSRLIAYLLCLFAVTGAAAQVDVRGTVTDRKANEPLTGASVIVKGADGKIKKFTSTKADGTFAMQIPSTKGCRIEVTMMGFTRQSLPLGTFTVR